MMKITRKVTVEDLADLLENARSATVAWNDENQVAAAPAAFRFDRGRYCIGVVSDSLIEGAIVSAVVDGGHLYFDLRGVRIRGEVVIIESCGGTDLDWFEVIPDRETAWHYGKLRER